MENCEYKNLFSPLLVNHLMIRNRVFAAPMGVPRAKLISSTFYGGISVEDKSKGELGGIAVSSYGPADIAGETDPFAKYARDVTREVWSLIEQDGAVGIMEFPFHPLKNEDGTIQSPSDGICYLDCPGKEMTHEQMKSQIDSLCKQCVDAKNFGVRMIMLHFGHDSQCSIFLSPVWNKRTDEYGGSLENRIRFAKEAIVAIRKAVGPNYPIMMRVSRQLVIPETYSEDDMMYFLKSIEGLVDIINISGGMDCYGGTVDHYEANVHTHTTVFEPRFYNLEFAERVKRETNHLVCLVGGVNNPKYCDELIRDKKIDAVMLGRQLVADPLWAAKACNGMQDEIVPCIRCLNCYHIATEHADVECSVNPRFRRENRVPVKTPIAEVKRKVVVVGGGPAGMKAAITASEAGHEVTLVEQSDHLGGQLEWAKYDDYKVDLNEYRKYLIHKIEKSNVKVMLNTKATFESISAMRPEVLLLALGGKFATPPIKGVENARQATEVYLSGIDNVDGDTVIIGGGTIGTEIALELAERNKHVSIIEITDTLSSKGNKLYRIALNQHLRKCKTLDTYLNSKAVEIGKDYVIIETSTGEQKKINAKNILLAAGIVAKTQESNSLYGITPHTVMIGDCEMVSNVINATNGAYFAASNIK